MVWIFALLVPAGVALAVVWRAMTSSRDRLAAAPAAVGIAVGLASVPWSALFFGGLHSRGLLMTLDLLAWALVLAAGLAFTRTRGDRPDTPVNVMSGNAGASRLMSAAAVTLVTLTGATATLSFVSASMVFPHGEWDAWAQWNLRARFFFRGLEDGTWQQAFAPVLAWSHPDYPPLVPTSIARLWTYAGYETLGAPIAFAGIVAACTVLAAGLSAGRSRGTARGCLAAAAILASPSFVRYAASQCADIALGFFMLAAFVAWSFADRQRLWLALAGLSAALAAWTKNEGAAFFVVFVASLAVERLWSAGWPGLKDLAPVLAGAAPILVIVVVFKLTLAPASYFVAEQSLGQAGASLFDASRAQLIGSWMARELWLAGASVVGVIPFLCVFAAVRGVRAPAPAAARAAAPAMVAMIAVYAIAYLVTPKDLVWQLKTSLDRLVVQIVPTLAWSIMTISR
jgi:hypothetical protein